MTAQKKHATRRQTIRTGVPGRGLAVTTRMLLTTAVMGCVVPAVGCKTGTSLAKPSWWTFGGTPKAAADALASAPPYGGDIKKPSESAKQYPTTSTPTGYTIAGTETPAGASAPQLEAAQSQAPIVYGSTPPPQPAAAAGVAAAPAAASAQQPAPSSIAPQVGPYASLTGDSIPPPGQPLPPLSPSTTPSMASASGMQPTFPSKPAEAALPNQAYSSFSSASATAASAPPPGPRMADARAVDPAAAIPAAALPVEAPAYGGSRYTGGTGSRFGAAEAASVSPPPASYPSTVEPGLPAPAAAAPFAAPPASMPSAPPAAPGLLQPSAQPVRRPDPGYRPGNTSSYRPSRTILADDAPPSPTAVRAASYEEPAVTIQQ